MHVAALRGDLKALGAPASVVDEADPRQLSDVAGLFRGGVVEQLLTLQLKLQGVSFQDMFNSELLIELNVAVKRLQCVCAAALPLL